MATFYDVRLPDSISQGAVHSLKRRTEITTLANGKEHRSTAQSDSLRRMNIAFGARNEDDIAAILELWDIALGELHAFRVQWSLDYKSCRPSQNLSAIDQIIGEGDGARLIYQLIKTVSAGSRSYARNITAIVENTIAVALDGVPQIEGVDYTVELETGLVTFSVAPALGMEIAAGYEFDLIMRFESGDISAKIDSWKAHMSGRTYGSLPEITLIEVI